MPHLSTIAEADGVVAYPSRLTTFVAWAAMTVIGALLVFVIGGFPGLYQVPYRVLTHVLTFGVVALAIALIIVRPSSAALPSLVPPGALVVSAMAVSAAASQWPRFGVEATIGAASALAVYVVLVNLLQRPDLRARLRITVVLLFVGMVVAYAAQLLIIWQAWYDVTGVVLPLPTRPAFAGLAFGTPNIVAGLFVLVGPLVCVWILGPTPRKTGRAIAVIGLAVVLGALLLVSGSRGGLLALGVAAIVGTLAFLVDRGGWRRRAVSGRRTAVSIGIVALIPAASLVALGPWLAPRLGAAGVERRAAFWGDSFGMMGDSPILGLGPGTWAFAHWAFRDPSRPLDVVAHAHNALIQGGAELGIVGLVAGAIFVATVFRLIVRSWRTRPHREVGAIGAGLAGLAVQSMVDNLSDLSITVVAVALLLGWLEPAAPVQKQLGRRTAFAAMVVLAAAAATVGVWDAASLRYLDGVRAQDRGDFVTASSAYGAAEELDPGYPLYAGVRGVALGHLGDVAGSAAALSKAADLTGDPFFAIQAAEAYLAAGDKPNAARALEAASARGVMNTVLAINAGRAAELLNRPAEAMTAYQVAIASRPELSASDYWRSPERPKPAVDVISDALDDQALLRAFENDPGPSAVIAWAVSGESGRALGAAASLSDATQREALTHMVAALGGDGAAMSWLRAAAQADPVGPAVIPLAIAANRLGDGEADRYRVWAGLLSPGSGATVLRHVLVGDGSAETPRLLGVDGWTHDEVYLRDRPLVLLAPQSLDVGYR